MVFVCNVYGMTEVELAKTLADDLDLRLEINEFGIAFYLNTHFVDSLGTLLIKPNLAIKVFVISEKWIFNEIREKAKKLAYISGFKDGIIPISL